jgi:hypothetical protein
MRGSNRCFVRSIIKIIIAMKKKKETRGRKAIPNNQKVVPITFYVSPETINAIGGVEKAREECKEFLIGLAQFS